MKKVKVSMKEKKGPSYKGADMKTTPNTSKLAKTYKKKGC